VTSTEVSRFCAHDVHQCPWDLSFVPAERAGEWVHPKGTNSMAASGLGCRKAMVGTGWAISLLFCMNWLRIQHSGLVGPPFLTVTFLLVCNWPSLDYWELVNEWVWFESWICREWLQGQLGEVFKTQGNRNNGTLNGPIKWSLENLVQWLIG